MKNRKLLLTIAAVILAFSGHTMAYGTDRDLDNDGLWDYGRGGQDRDLDNDGIWDHY